MHPIINHLIQLQELNLIRVEQKTHRKGQHLSELDASVESLTAQLPPDVRATVSRMQKRDPLIIVPVSNGICTGCGMKVPTSLVQAVRVSDHIQVCPICTRILYYPEGTARHIAHPPSRTEPRRAGVLRFSGPELMIPRLAATTRDDAIRELARKMRDEGYVDDADKLTEAALRREAIVGTAVDNGLAFPHVRGVEGGGLTFALGISPKGVRFENHDKLLVRFVFFVVIPTAASAFYLKLLAGLAETFMEADARKTLLEADTPAALWKALVKATRKRIP
jgi:mannitol/fructose-specific phosphotransferase system IIA component (Ntr-type)